MNSFTIRLFLSGFAIVALLPDSSPGQVGNDNPTGPSGGFNGNVSTAGSYDPYTGNAKRSVTDLVVAGSVGSYPLAFTRTANSRNQVIADYGPMSIGFGKPGLWQHSYQWAMDGINETLELNYQPTQYNVYLPDGRYEIFTPSSSDSCFRSGPGVRDRFQPLDWNTMRAYLIFPDGGKVEFTATRTTHWNPGYTGVYYSISYQATAILDPYGERTVLAYNWDGTLNTIQEPAGRWIQIVYMTPPWTNWWGGQDRVIDHVQSSDGRIVQYNYANFNHGQYTRNYTHLVNVVYPADPGISPATAHYTYQSSNYSDPFGGEAYPLLATCDDPMYAGPMKRIAYVYATANEDGSSVVAGQIRSENYFDGANAGAAVSTLTVNSPTARTETRGDGPSRTFNYNDGKLINYTDFQGQTSSISYDGNGYMEYSTDARGNPTHMIREGTIGALSQFIHADQTYKGYAYWYANGGPYYIQIQGDERGHNTYFTRDGNFRLTRIDYADNMSGAFETFTYNNFGQILTHRMTSGGTESFLYDEGINPPRGLKTSYIPPATPSDPTPGSHPTRYYYDGYDRLLNVTDPFGNATWFDYNVRGQVTKVTHQDGSYIQNRYNPDGTLAWTADENHPNASWNENERTRYTYDDYKRVVSVKNPMNETTQMSYALDWVNPLLHTTNSVKYVLSPLGKNVVFDYDQNFRRVDQAAALGTPDEAWTLFEYDAVGNLSKVTDPLSHATTFGYDNRNRQTSITDALGYATTTNYDAAGNKNWIKRATGTGAETILQFPDYDSMNQLTRQIDERGVTSTMGYDLAGNLAWNNDGNGNHYSYEYDGLNRRKKVVFPDGTTEEETYDAAGNPATHKNRAGNIQTLFYDNRNRQLGFDWNDGFTPQVRRTYDAASRVTQIWNWDATIDNTYFDDNALASQREITGDCGDNTPRTVSYTYDADGNRATMTYYYAGITYNYHYTSRNQLKDINYQNYPPMITYQYDKADNRTVRSMYNGTTTDYAPVDALNRSSWVRHTFAGGQTARFDYAFDEMSRLKYEQRNSGTADGFSYDAAGEVVNTIRDGTLSNGAVTGTSLPLSYDGAGNRTHTWGISYTANNLNEYTSVGGAPVTSDAKGNLLSRDGWTYTYDAQNRLRRATDGTKFLDFYYDGLNRQITRGVQNGSGWKVTFSVWDGWNLLEEHGLGDVLQRIYFYGDNTDELACAFGGIYPNSWFTQDGRGNVSHAFNDSGNLVERYTYGLAGAPLIWDPSNNALSESTVENRFMFQGRDYLKEGAIYDYRNRFYLPSLGGFIQPDPIGFAGDAGNLYRYCGGDPVNGSDPFGLEGEQGGNNAYDRDDHPYFDPNRVWVSGASIYDPPYDWAAPRLADYLNSISLFGEDFLRGVTDLVVGENRGEAWQQIFSESGRDTPTGSKLPGSITTVIENISLRIPANAAANGMHAWHAGVNARLAQKLGLVGMPAIILVGIYHETPGLTRRDRASFMSEQRSQGTINHLLDSTTDIFANIWGMNVGYLQPGARGVNTAIYYGNYIPGPSDFGENHTYKGNPAEAWRR